MSGAVKVLAWVCCLAVAIPLIVVAALFAVLNTGFGQRLAAREAGALSGGAVEVSGISGALPWNMRVAHVALRDAHGTYATLDALHLRWSPLALLSRTLRIQVLTAGAIDVTRLPSSAAAKTRKEGAPSASFSLPARVVVGRLGIGRLALGAPVAGTAAVLSVAGQADLANLSRGTAAITVKRLDAPGAYDVSVAMTPRAIRASVRADEADKGLIAGIAHLPNLEGRLHLDLSLDGPRDAEAVHLALSAGPLSAQAGGMIDLVGRKAALDVTANAPAMAPAPGLSWRSVAIAAHVAGPWTRPEARGTVAIVALKAGGAAIGALDATVAGDQGRVSLDATATGLVVPGPKPDLLAGSPLHLAATVLLDTKERPVSFTLDHALVAATGVVDLGPSLHGKVHLALGDLAPFAAAFGTQAAGSAAFDVAFARHGPETTASLSGPVSITGGMKQLVSLIGQNGHVALDAALRETPMGSDITLRSLSVDGAALHLDAHGTDAAGVLDLAYGLDLPDLAAASPALRGRLALHGTAKGRMSDLATHVAAAGQVGTGSVAARPVDLTMDATGLPTHPRATVALRGVVDGAPLTLSADATNGAGGAHLVLRTLDWKSVRGTADLTLPRGAAFPLGTLDVAVAHLADLAPLTGQPVSGSLTAHVATEEAGGQPRLKLVVRARDVGLQAARIGNAALDGTINDPIAKPTVDLRLVAQGIQAGGVAGQANATITGPASAIAIRGDTALADLAGAPARVATRATVDVPGSRVTLDALTATWKGADMHLLAPAHIAYAPQVSVDRLLIGFGHATLDLAGRIAPTLDLSLHLANVTPELAEVFAPGLKAAGVANLTARLTGTAAAPQGTVRVAARGMRLLSGNARALPAADLLATLELAGDRTNVNARLTAGNGGVLNVTGTAPLSAAGQLDLTARGRINLAVANPILEANGKHVAGELAIDAAVRGPIAQPAISGTTRLSGGDVQDYAQGVHLSDISALVTAQGQTLRINNFLAHAGPGTIRLSGSVGIFTPGIPVDLVLRMENARPLSSDLLTADLDADIALRGHAGSRLMASGTIEVRHATINIPKSLPSSVARLHVVRAGQAPPKPPGKPVVAGLDLRVHAQPAIFVRGRGLFARLGGDLRVRGTTAAPRITNGFDMRNGNLSLAGANLTFTEGRVGFNGGGVTDKLDPTLHFAAQSTSGGITATLTVGGTASQPTIKLSSSPSLPQDEVLAHLLYGVSISQLTPLQIATIAQAIYSLAGGGGGGGVLGSVQSALGLDRLGVSSSTGTANGASVQAGKYVAPGVYVGATHSVSGSTKAQVQVDLTKRLKLNTEVGTGGGTVTGAAPQDSHTGSVGLSYQFEY